MRLADLYGRVRKAHLERADGLVPELSDGIALEYQKLSAEYANALSDPRRIVPFTACATFTISLDRPAGTEAVENEGPLTVVSCAHLGERNNQEHQEQPLSRTVWRSGLCNFPLSEIGRLRRLFAAAEHRCNGARPSYRPDLTDDSGRLPPTYLLATLRHRERALRARPEAVDSDCDRHVDRTPAAAHCAEWDAIGVSRRDDASLPAPNRPEDGGAFRMLTVRFQRWAVRTGTLTAPRRPRTPSPRLAPCWGLSRAPRRRSAVHGHQLSSTTSSNAASESRRCLSRRRGSLWPDPQNRQAHLEGHPRKLPAIPFPSNRRSNRLARRQLALSGMPTFGTSAPTRSLLAADTA